MALLNMLVKMTNFKNLVEKKSHGVLGTPTNLENNCQWHVHKINVCLK